MAGISGLTTLGILALSVVCVIPIGCTHAKEITVSSSGSGSSCLVFIGTYTPKGGVSKGVYVYRLNSETGALEFTGQTALVQNPSFLALHPNGKFLYAVNEVQKFQGQPGGGVTAFAVEPGTGALTLLNQQRSHGKAPCHIGVDATGQCVTVANYSSGSIAVLPIAEDGRLKPASEVIQHVGSGPNSKRQRGPHAHSVTLDPSNVFAFAADLGIDKIMVYKLNPADGKLVPNTPPWADLTPGSGPRHLAFHPSLRFVYVINELDSTVTALACDLVNGPLKPFQTVSALPVDFEGANACADIHVSADGTVLYGSNRGHDSIVIYAIDPSTGRLALKGHESTQGKNPRNFAIDPSGRFLLAANQDGNNVVVFRIDRDSGLLEPTGHQISVPKPVCITFSRP